jgi:hypothetical protein
LSLSSNQRRNLHRALNSYTKGEDLANYIDGIGASAVEALSGYEYTGGFADRNSGTTGTLIGDSVSYTQAMVDDGAWLRFGLDATNQAANDFAYWADPVPSPTAGIGLFGGDHMPNGVSSMFDFSFSGPFSAAADNNAYGLTYNAANGSLDFVDAQPGDLAMVRFDFNLIPQVTDTQVEVGLIWQTRAADGTPTFEFPLTTNSITVASGTVGTSELQRPVITAYFASNEDVNARALPAIRSNNPVLIQPLAMLSILVR